MNAELYNDRFVIRYATPKEIESLATELSFTDKSKLYQAKRLARSPWASAYDIEKLQEEAHGCLLTENPDGTCWAPSGLADQLLQRKFASVVDKRGETGKQLVLPWAKTPPALRDYQREAFDALQPRYRGIVNFATGLGKSMIITYVVQSLKRKALIIAPTEAIAHQLKTTLAEYLGDKKVGFFGSGKRRIADVTVGIAASVVKNIDSFRDADLGLIVVDEAHHVAATTFYTICEKLSDVGRIYGFTATDFRSDGKDLLMTAACGPAVIRRDARWGIQNGWLAEPYFVVRGVQTSGHDFKDDKLKSYKAHVLNDQAMLDRIRQDAQNLIASGKSTLILVDEISHGEQLSQQLGIPLAQGSDKESSTYIDQLNAGKIPGLVGTEGKISEGCDTRNVDALILANFVASKGLVLQAVGRGLRKTPTKDKVIILDYAPLGSTMLTRHAKSRIEVFREVWHHVRLVDL